MKLVFVRPGLAGVNLHIVSIFYLLLNVLAHLCSNLLFPLNLVVKHADSLGSTIVFFIQLLLTSFCFTVT